jgi:hypothetical protein
MKIIAAFLITLWLTFLALPFAYLAKSLPPNRYNAFDHLVLGKLDLFSKPPDFDLTACTLSDESIDRIRNILISSQPGTNTFELLTLTPAESQPISAIAPKSYTPSTGLSARGASGGAATNTSPTDTAQSSNAPSATNFPVRSPVPEMSQSRKRRVEATQKFFLTMSDQHLVTGFAIALSVLFMQAGVRSWDTRVTVLTFQVATQLSLVSFIIHICSLTVIRDYFGDKSRWLRNIRALLISAYLIIYLVILGVSSPQGFKERELTVCEAKFYNSSSDPSLDFNNIADRTKKKFNRLFFFFFFVGCARRLADMYYPPQRHRFHQLFARCIINSGRKLGLQVVRFERKYWPSLPGLFNRYPTRIVQRTFSLSFWIHGALEIHNSFTREVYWTWFFFSLGNAQLFFWISYKPKRITEANPNFGQLMPLFLLFLVFFALIELCGASRRRPQDGPRPSPQGESTPPNNGPSQTSAPDLKRRERLAEVSSLATAHLVSIWVIVFFFRSCAASTRGKLCG